MTRRTAAAAARRSQPSRLRSARGSMADVGESSTAAGDGSSDAGHEDGGVDSNRDDEEDDEPTARRTSARAQGRVSQRQQQRLVNADPSRDDSDGDEDGAGVGRGPGEANDSDTGADEAGESSKQQASLMHVAVKRGRGRPPKRGRGRPSKARTIDDPDDGGESDAPIGDASAFADTTVAGDVSVAPEAIATPVNGGGETPAADGDGDETVPVGVRDYTLRNDELELDGDPEGDKKIDAKGNLLGGRDFGFHTFTSSLRPDPEVRYCLSIDAAKIGGYRDSFYFYRNNPLLIKLNCSDLEKDLLIDGGQLSGHLRNRVVTMVAVRNVFKLHGARVIKGGRAVIDDYYEELSRKTGRRPGQLVESSAPNAPVPQRVLERRHEARQENRERERHRRRPDAFTHAATDLKGESVVTTFGDAGESPFERAKSYTTRRANMMRGELNERNWMMEMARSVRGMNHELLAGRAERMRGFPRPYAIMEDNISDEESGGGGVGDGDGEVGDEADDKDKRTSSKRQKKPAGSDLPIGVYEALSNAPHYPLTTQPQFARLERLQERPLLDPAPGHAFSRTSTGTGASSTPDARRVAILGGAKVGSSAWGVASVDQRVALPFPRAAPDLRIPAAHSVHEM